MRRFKIYKALMIVVYFFITQYVSAFDKEIDVYQSIKEDLSTIQYMVEKNIMGQDRDSIIIVLKDLNSKIDILLRNASLKINIISEEALIVLKNKIKETSDFKKVEIITNTLRNGYIYSKQLAVLIEMISFDSHRETTILNIKNSILDPINIGLVLEKFDFESNRKSVEKELAY